MVSDVDGSATTRAPFDISSSVNVDRMITKSVRFNCRPVSRAMILVEERCVRLHVFDTQIGHHLPPHFLCDLFFPIPLNGRKIDADALGNVPIWDAVRSLEFALDDHFHDLVLVRAHVDYSAPPRSFVASHVRFLLKAWLRR